MLNDVVADPDTTRDMSNNEARAWLAAMARHRARVAAYVRRTTHDPAEVDELLAEAWANAWCERVERSAGPSDEAELIRHARRACAQWKATHRREVEFEAAGEASSATSGAEQQEHLEAEFLLVLEWMRELPRQQFYALCFRQLRGARSSEVAAAINCSVSAAKTHYRRGMDALWQRRAKTSPAELDGL